MFHIKTSTAPTPSKQNSCCTALIALLSLLTLYLTPVSAVPLIAIAEQNVDGRAAISYQLNTEGTTFLSSDSIALSFDLHIAKEDIGYSSALYLVAKQGDKYFIRNTSQIWQAWDTKQFIPAKELTLGTQEHINVLKDQRLVAGEYQVYAGYKTRNGNIKYNQDPGTLVVFATDDYALQAVTQPEILRDYLYQGAINPAAIYYNYIGDFSPALSVMSASATESSTKTSGTTLQEIGVDEADRIKTDGELLFSLRSCATDIALSCLHSYRLQDSPATSSPLGSLQLSDATLNSPYYPAKPLGELYLRAANEASPRTLVWLNTKNSWQTKSSTYPDWNAYDNQTQIKFINANNPEQFEIIDQLDIEGELLASRLVDGVLYLLSRKSSYYWPPYNIKDPAITIKPALDFFLPHVRENNAESVALLDASQCYIPPQNSAKRNLSTLSTITAIPVNNPGLHQSRCIAGELETFYASSKALYFASSRYPYINNNDQLLYSEPEQITEIHKFSLQDQDIAYRASGQVSGHLGWQQDKKSFRLGEYQDTLRVASSEGSSWGIDSRTKITVLKEDTAKHTLDEISSISNLGKPGERLFAARFIGNRGYLVTFKKTDPLIVLDFTQPESPQVLGELEINGYSDFLQPLGDHYLLGVGKDAIDADSSSRDFAWYQGVKVSLFDVSNAENLREISSIIIGKRGTESTALYDHHGLTLLALDEQHYKLALPIELHETESDFYDYPNNPSAYYDWTHKGLYVFDITTDNNPDIRLEGKLISKSSDPYFASGPNIFNDRAVIQNLTVHYIHDDQVVSSEIEHLK
ncbi:MAG: hypothetical protein DRQ62_14690 [Gammaproteobacteria bacterium]|nr:MAG: hypothetical protein DRQ62_14690 [Gammaproteobacteria bacterium]